MVEGANLSQKTILLDSELDYSLYSVRSALSISNSRMYQSTQFSEARSLLCLVFRFPLQPGTFSHNVWPLEGIVYLDRLVETSCLEIRMLTVN